MTEVRFQPEPTFEAPVQIHVPGKGEQPMLWTFKYRDADEVLAFRKKWAPMEEETSGAKKPKAKGKDFDGIGYLMELVCGWELSEEFSRKNLEAFFKHYPTSAQKVVSVYFAELTGVRLKN